MTLPATSIHLQIDPLSLLEAERNALIVSSCVIDGQPVIVSRYGDKQWRMVNHPTNKVPAEQIIHFDRVPASFRETMRAIAYRYLQRGRAGQKRPGPRAVVKLVHDASLFLRYLESRSVARLAETTSNICAGYLESCRRHRVSRGGERRPMKPAALVHRFTSVEALYELSQYTRDPMSEHPWPGTSAAHLAGRTGVGTGRRKAGTPLMPDEVFTTLFQKAWTHIEQSAALLDTRDAWFAVLAKRGKNWDHSRKCDELARFVKPRGWRSARTFNSAVLDLRTACYVVAASLSGCRNHELAFVQTGAYYRTTSSLGAKRSDAQTYWWMRSRSTKTGAGDTEWMVPEAAVQALRVMERWAKPYQDQIAAEIAARRARHPRDPEIAEAERHQNALFLSTIPRMRNQVRTLSGQALNIALKSFARSCSVQWALASHQFRRKFANYAARSQFGDLRYLKEHFKHWSLDMTLGYALNESQEIELYAEVQGELDDIKTGVVESWLEPGAKLAGGYGANLMAWRGSNPVTIFKNRKHMVRSLAESTPIRSNGHAWCTADDNLCVGNGLERTRCGGCGNAVIGQKHAHIYRGLHDHLQEVAKLADIGEGGRKLVERDMQRCRSVLSALGQDAGSES
ncbi:MAG: integrase [Pseudomonadota bacterium]